MKMSNKDDIVKLIINLCDIFEKDNIKNEQEIIRGAEGYIRVSKKYNGFTHIEFLLDRKDINPMAKDMVKDAHYQIREFDDDCVMVFPSDKAIMVNGDMKKKTADIKELFAEKNKVSVLGICISEEEYSITTQTWKHAESFDDVLKMINEIDVSKPFYLCPEDSDIYPEIIKEMRECARKKLEKRMRHIKFKGDIIITDPCYVVRKRDESTRPKWKDFHIHSNIREYEDYDEATGISEEFNKRDKKLTEANAKWERENPDDWDDFSRAMHDTGIKNYIMDSTGVGDWSCETVNKDTGEIIGRFCADSGEVGVFLLEDILRYNPSFDYHLTKPFTTTLIKDFNGEVWLEIGDNTVVKGKGNVNFFTRLDGED